MERFGAVIVCDFVTEQGVPYSVTGSTDHTLTQRTEVREKEVAPRHAIGCCLLS